MSAPNTYKHPEAFCLMYYASLGSPGLPPGAVRERLWNSRDGVTPFSIMDKTGTIELIHVEWERDLFRPLYKPQEGERVFVDATPELKRPWAEKYVEKWWEESSGGAYAVPALKDSFPNKEGAVAHFCRCDRAGPPPEILKELQQVFADNGQELEDQTDSGEPWIVTVTRGY